MGRLTYLNTGIAQINILYFATGNTIKLQAHLPVGFTGRGGSCPFGMSLACAGAGSAERGRRRGDLNRAFSPVLAPGKRRKTCVLI